MTDKVQWKTLPTKANRDMEQAGADAAREYLERNGHNNLWVIYEAMTAAAPKPPASTEPVVVALIAEDRYQETDVIQCDGIHSLPVGTELIDRAAYDLCRAEVLQLVAALDLVGQGLSIADGAKNIDAMRQEIHELQERDLDQLALLVESKDLLQRLAAEEKLRGSTLSAAELERLAREIGVHSIEPITDGTRPVSRLALQRDLERLKAASHWDDVTQHSLKEQLDEYEEGRLQLNEQVRSLSEQLTEQRELLFSCKSWIESARNGVLRPIAADFSGQVSYNAEGLAGLSEQLLQRIGAALSDDEDPSAPVELVSEDDLRDLASSACQEAFSFGVNEDVFMRLARTVELRARAGRMR